MHALCQPGAPQRGWEAQSARARRVVPPNWTTTGTESRHPNCRVETESRRLRTKWSAEKQNRWASHNPQVKVRKRKTTRWRDTMPAATFGPCQSLGGTNLASGFRHRFSVSCLRFSFPFLLTYLLTQRPRGFCVPSERSGPLMVGPRHPPTAGTSTRRMRQPHTGASLRGRRLSECRIQPPVRAGDKWNG